MNPSNQDLDKDYWEQRWRDASTPWDIGYPSPPLVAYLEQIEDKSIRILIPGAGAAPEAAWLIQNGFHNFQIVDWSESALNFAKEAMPEVPENHFQKADFFELLGEFDLILEQTFFCALNPSMRPAYARKMSELLKLGGTLAGLLFQFPLEFGPPFGGNKEEYLGYFEPFFDIRTMETCYNSIAPRSGRELFFILKRRILME